MELEGRVAVVTGGASGIGAGLAKQFLASGAEAVVVADIDIARARGVAESLGERCVAAQCDVGKESEIQALVQLATDRFGRVDVYASNAGILGKAGGIELPDELWSAMWNVHVMAHVWASRAVLPQMLERGEGYFLVTASAAGLLNIVETAPYGVTKHAAVAFAEWLRIAYGRRGIRVSCLCPQSVLTAMTAGGAGSAGVDGVMTPEQVALNVVDIMRQETFLALPHPEVASYMKGKTDDYDRWLGGMQKMYGRHMAGQ